MKNAWLALLLVQTACATGTVPGASLPRDVSEFVERRDLCDHFRGEIPEPEDHWRMEEVVSSITLHCSGTDEELARLRSKYIDDPDVRDVLGGYEATVEAHSR